MKFYMPTRVFDEKDCVKKHAADLSSCGTKALIVTGRHSAEKCRALADVTQVLEDNGTAWCHFAEIEENPSVETVVKGAIYGKEQAADFVIGIGGGSAMDAAKAIAFLMYRPEILAEDLYNGELPTRSLDVVAVPTTCGTGSEVTGVSVLTRHEKKTKASIPHRIFPKLALVDGKYLANAPQSIITNTAVDALAHMIESYESKAADDYSKAAALAGLRIWSSCKDLLLPGGCSALRAGCSEAEGAAVAASETAASAENTAAAGEEAAARLMRASTFAGIAIAQTGTSIPHALSYTVTYDLHMPHGMACGYFLTGFLKEMPEEDRSTVLEAAGFTDVNDFCGFMEKAFPGISVPEEVLRRAYDTVSANPVRMSSCRFYCDAEVLARITGSAQA